MSIAVNGFVDIFDNPSTPVGLYFAPVVSVGGPGTSSDNRSLVTVNVKGSVLGIPYDIDKPIPNPGDTVTVLVVNSVPIILGRHGGFPLTS